MSTGVATHRIKESFFNLSEDVIESCNEIAKDIAVDIFPNVDFNRQENIDLVIRPLSSVIAINEIVMENLFSESTIDGIRLSKTIPVETKVQLLKNFCRLNNIPFSSSDMESLYSEIVFFIQNNNINRPSTLRRLLEEKHGVIDRLFFCDTEEIEMVRNKISYIQLDHQKIMDFTRSEHNLGDLIGSAYSREEYNKYQEYKKSDRITIPSSLDIYFSTEIIRESVVSTRYNGLYVFDAEYYIDIVPDNDKDFVLVREDIQTNGITKTKVSIHMDSGLATETFYVTRYIDPMFEEYINTEEFSIQDTLYKGFYPLFVDFTLYSRNDFNTEDAKLYISEYLSSVSGNMSNVSVNEIQNMLFEKNIQCAIGTTTDSILYRAVNDKIKMSVIFPLSKKDIQIPPEIDSTIFTERTIKIFVGNVTMVKE